MFEGRRRANRGGLVGLLSAVVFAFYALLAGSSVWETNISPRWACAETNSEGAGNKGTPPPAGHTQSHCCILHQFGAVAPAIDSLPIEFVAAPFEPLLRQPFAKDALRRYPKFSASAARAPPTLSIA